jgi:isocitrate lyase
MPYTKIDTVKEEKDYWREVEQVKKWWTQPRFRKIKR